MIKKEKDDMSKFKIGEKTLKRNEPMKIDSSKHYVGLGFFKCPKCGEMFIEEHYNYCPDCGQKLDWSDEDE